MREKDINNILLCAIFFLYSIISGGSFAFATENLGSDLSMIETQTSSFEVNLVERESAELNTPVNEISTIYSENSSLEESGLSEKESSGQTETIENTLEVQEFEPEKQVTNASGLNSEAIDTVEVEQSENILEDSREGAIKLGAVNGEGIPQIYNQYVNIKGNYHIWDSFEWKKDTPGLFYKNQTFDAKEIYHHSNGSNYLSLYDKQGKFLGYINELGTTTEYGAQGFHYNYGKYVSIKGNYHIWDGFDWKNSKSGLEYKNQTFEARGFYNHFNGFRYLSLYDSQGKWVGYINELGTVVGYGTQGPHQDYGRYVSIKGNYDIWDGFDWKKNTLSTMYKNQTFEARGFYNHFNGSRYLSLYDNEGKWLGYINELGTMLGNGAQGAHQKYDKYVSINGNYNIWNSFDWKTSQLGSKYKNQMFHARGVYNHFNNSRYLSLYDNQGKWLGYINENGTILENGAQGPSTDYRKYVSIKGSYDIWTSFNWGKKHPGLEYKNQTFEARTVYNHFNGSRYLSLYDNKGIWLGYINEIGIIQSDGEQGVYQNYGKYVNIEGNYNIWNGFNWKKNQSGIKYKNQKIEARGIYHHFNGSRYLSLYNNKGKWLGYMNANGVNYTYKYWTKKKNTWYYFDDDGLEIDNHQTNFISKNILDVLRITDKYDLYPSIMLGQAILESGYGTSELAKNANNFFGMKFKENEDEGKYDTYFVETKEYDSEKNEMVTILAPFRKYRNKLHSFEDNALKLRQGVSWDNNYYAGAWRENTKNYKEVSAALTGKYATDPQYYQKLNSIIERWELHQFD